MAELTRTTGNDPVSGTDPGGTRPRPAVKSPAGGEPTVDQKVRSGDRNDGTHSEIGGANQPRPSEGRPG